MARFVFIGPAGERREVEASPGTTAMRAAVTHGIDGILGECGGSLACATCHVYVEPSQLDRLSPPGADEDAMLDLIAGERRPNSRLGCQIVMRQSSDDLELHLPPRQA